MINQHAKTVIKDMLESGTDAQEIVTEKNLVPVDEGQVNIWVEEVLKENPQALEDLKSGNMKPLGFIVWQVMKKSSGSADPAKVNELVRSYI